MEPILWLLLGIFGFIYFIKIPLWKSIINSEEHPMGKEIVLVTASWCTTCGPVKKIFNDLIIPDVSVKVCGVDDDDVPLSITSVPVIIFKQNGEIVLMHYGVVDIHTLKHMITSLWPDIEGLE